ncbi:hypothetical protein CONLIGDRAFT_411330 [Coniochaeta ligniaria NRRL 30616]|uniref:Transmembrane protein n=1 Tax=Coniochaeta ligniaria NRRL 30616 TaxID=1408157 RepID=A0A1J7JNC0_9PEZI|nr:hypothetical protein CONLIGDRAFT_411330 [Coniochaeta ligniaria NRRL 30616]
MRRPKRAAITSWARRSRTRKLRLPRWKQAKTAQSLTPWKWLVRLIRMLCVISGTALAGATFWYGYDGYLDNKCMTMMQEWSNMVDLLDHCDQDGSDSTAQGTTCEKINRHALPEPPSCVSHRTEQTAATRPTVSPDFTSELGAPRNASRAVSTAQDPQRSTKQASSGWDTSTPIEPAVTPTASASQQSTASSHATPTTLIQSRTVTLSLGPSLISDMPLTPTPTVAISDLIPPPLTSAYPTQTSHGDPYAQCYDRHHAMIEGLFGLFNLAGSLESPLEVAFVGTTPAKTTRTSEQDHAIRPGRPFVPDDLMGGFLGSIGTDNDLLTDCMTRGPVASYRAGWSITCVCAPLLALAYCSAMVLVARRYKKKKRKALALIELKS